MERVCRTIPIASPNLTTPKKMRKLLLLSPILTLFVTLAGLARGQAPPLECLAQSPIPLLARSEGLTEQVGDLTVICTGGTPTPAGHPIATFDFTVTLSLNLTSKLTSAGQWQFTEVLLFMDEPGSGNHPTRPILNCGNNGAPDAGLFGPGVCTPISTGNPALSYDGTPNGYGTATCDGLAGRPAPNSANCGRPNAFQGRLTSPNQVTFFSVPLDPPGLGAIRTLRFTNLRVNATQAGHFNPPQFQQVVRATVSVDDPISVPIASPQQEVADVEPGLNPSPSCSSVTPVVCIQEGFYSSWRPKNISSTVGNGIPGNASYSVNNPNVYWDYNGGQNYPPDVAQNVPGAIYNSESAFEWQNNSPNGPPSPNPPKGIGAVTVEQGLSGPLNSIGFLFPSTGINSAGIADSGTRIGVRFNGVPAGASIQIPTVATLSSSINASSGVMVLTNTDSVGAGAFSPYPGGTVTLINNAGSSFAYYEVLWADPFSTETAAVPYTVLNAPPGTNIQTFAAFAPFYSDSFSFQASATGAVPRFADTRLLCSEQSCLTVTPTQGVNAGPTQLSFTNYGSQSLTGAQVTLRAAGVSDIIGTNVTSSTPNNLSANFDLTAATPGARDVVITPVGQNPIVLPAGFSILLGPLPLVTGQTLAAATAAITAAGFAIGTVTQQWSDQPAGIVIGQSLYNADQVNLVVSTSQLGVLFLIGLRQSDANLNITSEGFVVGTVTQQASSVIPAGSVIAQSPAPGTPLNPGSAVNLVISTGPAPVPVPNVVGQTQAVATAAITTAGLVLWMVTPQSSSSVPSGEVISESPAAGTLVSPGSAVSMVVSTGPAQVGVPNVLGLTLAQAVNTLTTGFGLVAGTVTQQSSATVPSGDVISESPSAGTLVNVGSAVNLVTSAGPAPVAVPNVVGQTQAAATAAIVNAGLSVASAPQVYTNLGFYSGPQNLVLQGVPGTTKNLIVNIAGFPAGWDCLQLTISSTGTSSVGSNPISSAAGFALAGSLANYSQALSLNLGDPFPNGAWVANPVILWGNGITGGFSDGEVYAAMQSGTESQGPYYAGWIHFKLQNSALPTATLTVIDWAYDIGAYPLSMGQIPVRDVPAGTIISESPAAGTVVAAGSGVNLNVSGGPLPVGVPNVVSLPQTAGTNQIITAGLLAGTVTQQSSSTVPSGSVISQSPAASTTVVIDSSVNLVISSGPAQVPVPNVVGTTQAAATSAITGAGLVVGTVTQQSSSTVPSGSVITEAPAAGTSVNVGSAVNLVVSTGPAMIAVPNVVGSTQAGATTAITTAGLVVGTVTQQSSSTVAAGSVISESPVAGTLVTVGSVVNLVVSSGSGQAGPPPTFVQVNHNEISSGSSVAAAFNAATKAGNTIVVYAIWDNAGSASVTDSRGDHFVSVSAPLSWESGYSSQIFYATNIVGGTDTVTTAFATRTNSFGVIYAHEYSGIDLSNPVDVTASASGSSSALNSGTAATTSANDLIFGAGVSDNNVSGTGSGFTARDLAYGNITEDRTAATLGSYSATATHYGQKWGMQMVAFRPAAGSGGGGGGSVAAPSFTPPAGSFTTAQSVKLATTTAGATIYYTTDGTTPTISGTAYTVPINVKSSLTIKAFAHESGMTDSPVVSAAYQISTGAGTPPAFVQVNDNEISSGSSVPVTLNLPTQAGNTIVVYAIWDNAGSASITDVRGDHFVSVSAPVSWGNGYSAQIFYATNIAGGTDTVTAAFQTTTTSFGVIYAHEYSGISASNPIDVIASASGSSPAMNSGTATTTTANDLIFGAGVSDNNVDAAGSGFNARDLGYGNITEDKTATSIGSYSATATHYGQQWGMQMVAFRPAP
jgi:beta-lactam-binding protein with PASTA domain